VNSIGEDRELLAKCVSGDREASEILIRRFSNLVYHSVKLTLLTKNVSFNNQDLEDLHNTVFLQLFEQSCRKLKQYQGRNGCSLASWIRIVAVRMVLNHVRKKGMDAIVWQKKRIPFEDLPELKGEATEALKVMEKRERARLVQDGIRSLPPRDRLFLKLHFDQELPVAEVAAALQMSVQNAYTVKHRAIKKLKHLVAAAN
jgi:RNA polymerase sigma-70 factor (ECF subfamily)